MTVLVNGLESKCHGKNFRIIFKLADCMDPLDMKNTLILLPPHTNFETLVLFK